jgi:hypothetical protein
MSSAMHVPATKASRAAVLPRTTAHSDNQMLPLTSRNIRLRFDAEGQTEAIVLAAVGKIPQGGQGPLAEGYC